MRGTAATFWFSVDAADVQLRPREGVAQWPLGKHQGAPLFGGCEFLFFVGWIRPSLGRHSDSASPNPSPGPMQWAFSVGSDVASLSS